MDFEAPPVYDAFAVIEDQIQAKKTQLPKLIAGFEWLKWLGGLTTRINRTAERKADPVRLTNQEAAIGTTALPIGTVEAGLYRISYYLRITQAAGGSSTVTPTFSWTDGGVAMSASGAPVTGNTTDTEQFGTLVIRSDASQPISYSTALASVGAPPMKHSLYIVVEQVSTESA